MRKKKKRPLSWKIEEYAFGAAALRDEIKRHKEEDEEHWSILTNVGIRMLLLYAVIATLVLALGGIILSGIQRFKR